MPIVEAMAVMGRINPFFEKAGMQPYTAATPVRNARLLEALRSIGIEDRCLINPRMAHDRITRLDRGRGEFIEREIDRYLQSYGRRREMHPGINRTKFVCGRLTDRPAYYIWFNEGMELRI